MLTHAVIERRFSPTPTNIVLVAYIQFLKTHKNVRIVAIAAGVLFFVVPTWLTIHQNWQALEGRPILFFPVSSSTMLVCGGFLLYTAALAGSGYHVFVAPRPEEEKRIKAEANVKAQETPRSLVELDSARLAEYYAINQSQAKASFRWALFAFLLGFGTILLGIWLFYLRQQTKSESMTWLTSIAGVVTNAVAAMFLYLYKQTHERSLFYYKQLVRIQMIDLAIRLADGHTDDAEKTKAKNKVISQLLLSGHSVATGKVGVAKDL